MQIVSLGDNLHEMSNPVSPENKKKIFQNVVCWKLYPEIAKKWNDFFLSYLWIIVGNIINSEIW